MASPVGSSSFTWTISPTNLTEYATALYQILEICTQTLPSDLSSPGATEALLSYVRRLLTLRKQLQNIQDWILIGAPTAKARCQQIRSIIDPLDVLYQQGASPQALKESLTSIQGNSTLRGLIQAGLEIDALLSEGDLDVPPEDVMFIQIFRKFNNQTDIILSDVGDSILAASTFLEGLNLLNEACTWNPGQRYISPDGTLTDVSTTDRWYPLFIAQVDSAKIEGIRMLRDTKNANVFPNTSNESVYLNKILDKIDGSESEGGFSGLYNERLVKKMWEDQAFQTDVRTAIELALTINEQAQQEVNRALFQSKVIADATANIFENQNQSLTNIAKRINR